MMISRTAEYALRAVLCLARQKGAPLTTEQIAVATHVPAGYLSKVLQSLRRSGFVQAQRGLHGGFVLTREPSEVSVLEVVNAVDRVQRIHECPLGLEAHAARLCALHRRLDAAAALVESSFRETSLGELLAENGDTALFCACERA